MHEHQENRDQFQMRLAGYEIGVPGAGGFVSASADPTQGPGTPSWQRAVSVQMKLNASQRRN